MSDIDRQILSEIREAPDVARRQAQGFAQSAADLLRRLERRAPDVVVTCARGSSAHAATFAKHLIEHRLGIPCAAAAPNIASIYHRPLRLKHQLFLAISQSGRSDDLVESASLARTAGAVTVALVNETDSPLASACELVLPIGAGPERSVIATKTFVATLVALLRLTAEWCADNALKSALERLPERLASASGLPSGDRLWRAAGDALGPAESVVTIGRGPTLAIAREAALKLKEACSLHAEAFSGAEFMHGPVSLVSDAYPLLVFAPGDAAGEGLRTLAADLCRKGAAVFITAHGAIAPGILPMLAPDHPETDAVCQIQAFYAFMVELAQRRGTNPARPRHLRKITRTR
ncbi:MAG TPA: SIS domain-containing protein [Xanthobacteraceae bacterium]|jgi:glucosamine--fructose-6-phosphate aminotransferase (isomerizing)